MNYMVIQYLLSIKEREYLYKNNIFCLRLLKILGSDISKLIIELMCIAKHVKNTKGDKSRYKILKNLNILYKDGNNIFINKIFLSSIKKGFAEKNPTNIFYEEYVLEEKGLFDERKIKILQLIVEGRYDKCIGRIDNILKYKKIIEHGKVTQKGFEFLLKSKREQTWEIILSSIDFINELNKGAKIDLLIMLFEMGNCGGKFYRVKAISAAQKDLLKYLDEIGLVKIEQNGIRIYNEMKWLFSNTKEQKEEYLIIETNFKIYAYCSHMHEIAILKLFSTLYLALPNLTVGMITEESVSQAFNKGIKAEQIVHYLQNVSEKPLPNTIKDQFFIWENNRNRIYTQESYLYSGFSGFVEYKKVMDFTIENNLLLEKDDDRRILIVTADGHKMVKNFVKNGN
ncbi:Transcription factor Tfb2 [Spraguea lophii 42_110]|uniref:RNA polymerase II transcription factor B subunit 2 n=1 Tax=Spraguea lophii (strain 42_110) TaxID=1358809 RepID=S7W585_SPRLO|nr:Transcription factor Tfb2 [Spraguea lophii 42_110]